MDKIEMKLANFEFSKETIDGEEFGIIEGYGAVFGNTDQGGDIIEKGAFKNLPETIPMLWQHDTENPIGAWFVLKEDDYGLFVRGKIALGVKRGQEAYELLKMRAITGFSIGYSVNANGFKMRKDGVRILTSLRLREVSIVTMPMNELAILTNVKKRGLNIKEIDTKRKLEKSLRDLGFSKGDACFVASGWQPPKTAKARDSHNESGLKLLEVLKQTNESIKK